MKDKAHRLWRSRSSSREVNDQRVPRSTTSKSKPKSSMAAIDVPWVSPIDNPMSSRDQSDFGTSPPTYDYQNPSGVPPTYAAFSPVTLQGNTPSRSARRSTVLVHQKSPLLLATPPQVTRALAYSHPFLLPLNTVAGLLTWSTGDTWQSFLLLCSFWGVVLYGDAVVKWAGPVAVAAGLILGMYGRRYSPLSTSGRVEHRESKDAPVKASAQSGTSTPKGSRVNGEKGSKHQRAVSELTKTKHQKTLDEIVETLKEFTGRCNTLMDPFLEMTDFLSTQTTPTSATTRPALIAMFIRLLVLTPFWVILALPPWRVITTRRIVLLTGTLGLSWHSRAMRVTRVVLWRSIAIRKLASAVTGLRFETPAFSSHGDPELGGRHGKRTDLELTKALKKSRTLGSSHRRGGSDKGAGLKFTFIIYENQRRWVGLGWTNSLFAYERHAWTDEHNSAVPPKDEFELPEVEDGSNVEWRWVPGSRWRVDGILDDQDTVDYDGEEGKNGWIYYDNRWQNGRRGEDGWGRWTRRRKWYRDAELVEAEIKEQPSIERTSTPLASAHPAKSKKAVTHMRSESAIPPAGKAVNDGSADDSASAHETLTPSKSFFFSSSMRRRTSGRPASIASVNVKDKDKTKDSSRGNRPRKSSESISVIDDDARSGLGIEVEMELNKQGKGSEWGIGDEAGMSLS